MRKKTRFLAIIIGLFTTIFSLCTFAAADFKAGKDYRVLTHAQASTQPEVVEFFSYGCPGCFAFERMLRPWVKSHKNILFKRVPVVFHPQWEGLAKAYYIANAYNKEEKITAAMFSGIHLQHLNLNDPDVLQKLFVIHGIPAEDFQKAFNQSPTIMAQIKAGEKMQNSLQINLIPALIVNGRYLTDMEMANNDPERLLAIVGFLTTKK